MSDYQQPQPYPAQPAYQPAYAAPVDAGYIAQLEQRVRYLEAKCATTLVSGGFFKKAFACWGYTFVASFIIGTIVSIVTLILSLLFGVAFFGALQDAIQQSGASGPY